MDLDTCILAAAASGSRFVIVLILLALTNAPNNSAVVCQRALGFSQAVDVERGAAQQVAPAHFYSQHEYRSIQHARSSQFPNFDSGTEGRLASNL
jgi:hypothetical protein